MATVSDLEDEFTSVGGTVVGTQLTLPPSGTVKDEIRDRKGKAARRVAKVAATNNKGENLPGAVRDAAPGKVRSVIPKVKDE